MESVTTAIIIVLFAVALGCAGLLIATRERKPRAVIAECGECGHPILEGDPMCVVVDTEDDPSTGGAFLMRAEFHPDCCPVIDPKHEHAS